MIKQSKSKIGRPKLANRSQKKTAILVLSISFILLLTLTLFSFLTLNISFNKLDGKIDKVVNMGKSKKFYYYTQINRYTRFCGRSGANIGTSGCGTTSMAMILTNLTGNKKFTPEYTMKEAYKGGYCGPGISGTNWHYFKYSAKKHNLKYESIPVSKKGSERVKEILREGGLVIANVNYNSPYTHGGHYIVIYKVDKKGYVYVANPNRQGIVKKGEKPYKFVTNHWFNAGWWGFFPKTTTTKKTTTKKTTTTTSATNPENKLQKLSKGKCPVAPTITSVLKSGSKSIYETNKVNIRINVSNLSSSELEKLYIVTKTYDSNRISKYTRVVGNNGKSEKKKEKIGIFNASEPKLVTSTFTLKNNGYEKTLNTGDYYYVGIWSGSKLCYYNYFVKENVKLNNSFKRFRFIKYNILTSNGLVKGSAPNATVKSSDSKVLQVAKKMSDLSLKASSRNSKNGSEKNKTATVVIKNNKISGSFKLTIPDRYAVTTYLSNPLTGTNKTFGSGKLTKASNTKDKKGNKVYGVEVNAEEGSKVYAMDSGTISSVRSKANDEDTYGLLVRIKSTTSSTGEEYFIHSYAHLNKVYVKKGQRVHKGQVIGTVGKTTKKGKKLSKAMLFVTFDHLNKKGQSEVLLLNNFVGRNLRYDVVTKEDNNYKLFQKYIADKNLCKYSYNNPCK